MLVADGVGDVAEPAVLVLLQEAYRHAKPVGAWGTGLSILTEATVPSGPGVLVADSADDAFVSDLVQALGLHRVWSRLAQLPVPPLDPTEE